MMKRPMLQIAIAYCTGIALAYYLRQAFIIIVIFPVIMLIYWYGAKKNIPFMKKFLLWGIFIICGYTNYAFQYTYLTQPLQSYYDNNITLVGYVNNACEVENDKVTFELFIENIKGKEKQSYIGRSVLVNVYNNKNGDNYSIGTRFIVQGVLERPPNSRNPGGFNYENYLNTKKIAATISLNENKVIIVGTVKGLYAKKLGYKMLQYILTSLQKNLSQEKAALIGAMITGYRGSLTEPMENAFSASGLTHIMAVSGANIAFLIFPLLWIFGLMGINRKTSAIITLPFIFLYVLITGMESSVLRASVMAVLLLFGRALDRKAELINSLAIASAIILFINPFMFFDVGFQLSVGATAGLGILYKRVRNIIPDKIPRFISDTTAATISAQAGVLPLLILYFNKISLVSIFSNILVVPVTGFATCLGVVCIIADAIHPLMGTIVGYALEGVLHFILVIADSCASVGWAETYMHHWNYLFILLYYILVILLGIYGIDFFRHHRLKIYVCIFVLGVILFVQGILPGTLKVIFTDVGQGDCIVIQTPEGKNYLIDGGGKYNEVKTGYCGRQIILPLLMHEGISYIDMVLVTHAHSDHMAGVLTLIDIFQVECVGLPKYPEAEKDFNDLIVLCESKDIPFFFYASGDNIQMDNKTTFEIINPSSEQPPYDGNLNNTSICGMLRLKDFSILFTGDIESEAEKYLLKQKSNLDCDILKVAHHGGKESTSSDFLNNVKPEVSIVSVGRNNFGHPSDEVIDRLLSVGSRIYTTEKCGAVIVHSSGNNFRVRSWLRDDRYTFF